MAEAQVVPYASASARGHFAVAAITSVGACDAVLAYAYDLDTRVFRATPGAAHLAELALPSLETPFMLVDIARACGLVIAAVLFLAWIHRAYGNLRALGATGLKHSPEVAVGAFLVPVANFVMPALVMGELRAKSAQPSRPARLRALDSLWWITFVCSFVLHRYLGELAGEVDPPADRYAAATELALGAQLAGVVAAVCAVLLIREIDRSQEARSEALAASDIEHSVRASGGSWKAVVGGLVGGIAIAIALVVGAWLSYKEMHGKGSFESARPGARVEASWRVRLESVGVPEPDEELLWFDHVEVSRLDVVLGFALTDRRVLLLPFRQGETAAAPVSLVLDEIRRVHVAWTDELNDRTRVVLDREPDAEPKALPLWISPNLGGDHAFVDALTARLSPEAIVTSNVLNMPAL